jgi:Ser/Thr protein kinase RdoA (MazF antagonist)
VPAAAVDRSVERVLAAFGLHPDRIEAIGAGNVNDSWDVQASSMRWILRRYSTARLPSGIPFEHAVLQQLASAGWPVPNPFAAPDGSTLVKVGGRFHALFPFLHGDRLDDPGLHGSVLGRLHAATSRLTISARPTWPRLSEYARRPFPESLAAYAAADPDAAAATLRHHGLVARELAAIGTDAAVTLPVHGDFHTGNLLFQEGRLSGVLDFDFARIDLRVADIAIALGFLADSPARAAFVAGYEAEQPLAEGERRLLAPLRRARELERLGYALRRWQKGDVSQHAEVQAGLVRLDRAVAEPT